MEYVRRKAFSFKDDFNSIEEANEYLEKICLELNQKPQKEHHNQSALDMLHMEQEYLLPKVPMYDAAKTVEPRVDKYSTIVIDQNHYSVPEQYVGKIIFVNLKSCPSSTIIASNFSSSGLCENKSKTISGSVSS